jgi:Ca-activated chloride channel homolog
MRIDVRTDRSLIRADGRSIRYAAVSVVAPQAEMAAIRRPVNIAFVLDRSGSMSGEKIVLAKTAIENALSMLTDRDRFSVVVFDDRVELVTESAFATSDAKRRALRSLAALEARGSTDLCGGWLRGCEQIALNIIDDSVNRCLLLTDGLANHGITSHDEIRGHSRELRERGIQTTTFGVGEDFDENLLRDLARDGGGRFYFISDAAQIPDFLAGELGEALEVVARGVTVHAALPRGADAEPLGSFRFVRAEGDNEVRVELGDMVSRQEIELVFKLTFPPGVVGSHTTVAFHVADESIDPSAGQFGGPSRSIDVGFRYDTHAGNDAQPRDRGVDIQVASLYAAHARALATECNRHGQFREAREALSRTARRIESYAGSDRELRRIARELREDMRRFGQAPMPAMDLKAAFFRAESELMSRDRQGRAMRSK